MALVNAALELAQQPTGGGDAPVGVRIEGLQVRGAGQSTDFAAAVLSAQHGYVDGHHFNPSEREGAP